jgi:hypothetical protein
MGFKNVQEPLSIELISLFSDASTNGAAAIAERRKLEAFAGSLGHNHGLIEGIQITGVSVAVLKS